MMNSKYNENTEKKYEELINTMKIQKEKNNEFINTMKIHEKK